jgi:hypothetical protein
MFGDKFDLIFFIYRLSECYTAVKWLCGVIGRVLDLKLVLPT